MHLNRKTVAGSRHPLPDGRMYCGPPERVLQFGEGNFLRSFVDWMIDTMNRRGLFGGQVVVVQPIERGLVDVLNGQDGLYTLILRGLQGGKVVEQREVIPAIRRGIDVSGLGCLSCRCREARPALCGLQHHGSRHRLPGGAATGGSVSGVVPRQGRPLLAERFSRLMATLPRGSLPALRADRSKRRPVAIVRSPPCRCLEPEPGVVRWVTEDNRFLNTLVDRIVPGSRTRRSRRSPNSSATRIACSPRGRSSTSG